MKAYADDLRQKVLLAVDSHQGSYPFLARIFHVSVSWIKSVVRRCYRTGNVHALAYRRVPAPKLSPALLAWLRLEIEHKADVTEKQLCHRLLAVRGISVSQPTVSRALASLGTAAQKKLIHANERNTPQAAERRANWQKETQAIPAERLVFVDETGTALNMTNRYGRAPRGVRVDGAVPGGR